MAFSFKLTAIILIAIGSKQYLHFFTGIDIPKCNFVMRYDFPKNYQSYVQCKSRARAVDALHVLLVPQEASKDFIWQLAQYQYIEKV